MKSPLFAERFKSDSWKTLLFDVLYAKWNRDKRDTDIAKLLSVSTTISYNKKGDKNQLDLF
jgi:hypothetical protein